MFTTSFIRRSLKGATVLAISFLLLASTGCSRDKDTGTQAEQPTTTTEVTTCTSTTSSVTTMTVEATTTSTVATTLRIETTVPMTETAVLIEAETVYEKSEYDNCLPITDYEVILLRNVVANEYGSDWVSIPEKAKVVAVVMNRVNSPLFPNTIEGVLMQPQQFTGYWACNYEWSTVTQSVRDAVDYYFANPAEFGNWLYFYGDGYSNYFS